MNTNTHHLMVNTKEGKHRPPAPPWCTAILEYAGARAHNKETIMHSALHLSLYRLGWCEVNVPYTKKYRKHTHTHAQKKQRNPLCRMWNGMKSWNDASSVYASPSLFLRSQPVAAAAVNSREMQQPVYFCCTHHYLPPSWCERNGVSFFSKCFFSRSVGRVWARVN